MQVLILFVFMCFYLHACVYCKVILYTCMYIYICILYMCVCRTEDLRSWNVWLIWDLLPWLDVSYIYIADIIYVYIYIIIT